ncbi:MAG: DNA-binding response regulator [Anaerolineales bacterium]|nr:DNA-binding response regulator [Anaerolineales bacterium]
MKGRILFADNDQRFLNVRAQFLKDAGYEIISSYSLEDTIKHFHEGWFHLALLDIRMVDNDDARDTSGLNLARDDAYRHIPKIMLTGFPTFEAVREALGLRLEGLPPAVDFLAKKEGPDILLQKINEAFSKHVCINWDLNIAWEASDRFALTTLLEPGLRDHILLRRADEVEDLFRRLFFEFTQIRLTRLFWRQPGRVALAVLAFKEGAPPESFLVICGLNQLIQIETNSYKDHSPKSPGANGTALTESAQTTHFAANSYALAGVNLPSLRSLETIYRAEPSRVFKTVLKSLFDTTLTAWHRHERMVNATLTLDEHYRQLLGLVSLTTEDMENRIRAILQQIPSLGIKFTLEDEIFTANFGTIPYIFQNPIYRLYQNSLIGHPVVTLISPGHLTGDNILTELNEQVWLTDFAQAGLYPHLWNFIALEGAIRYDWIEVDRFVRLHEMEHALNNLPFASAASREVEPELRDLTRTIDDLRQLAAPFVGKDELPYHLGMFYQAMHRLANYQISQPLTKQELARFAYILLSAAMLAEKLQHVTSPPLASPCLTLDHSNRMVHVHGKRVVLGRQGYDILHYLYENSNKLCKREDIYRDVLGMQNWENLSLSQKKSEENRLNASIRRLREKIEDDPDSPQFLLTETGVGYRLIDCP